MHLSSDLENNLAPAVAWRGVSIAVLVGEVIERMVDHDECFIRPVKVDARADRHRRGAEAQMRSVRASRGV